MKKLLTLFLLQFIITFAYAQKSFEGEVVYSVSFKLLKDTNTQIHDSPDTKEYYYMKGGNYKLEFGNLGFLWVMYISQDKKLYSSSSPDTIEWRDATVNQHTLTKVELKKNDTTILGYKCNKLIFNYADQLDIYYFNSQFAVEPNLYIDHKIGDLYAFFERSKAIPLEEIILNKFSMRVRTAISIEKKSVDDKVFKLPSGVELVEIKTKP